MSDTDVSSRLKLPFILPSQAQKHVTYNSAIERLDALVQLVLEAVGIDTPPASPADGDVWAIGEDPTGAWAGHSGELAQWLTPGWSFFVPHEGWRAWDKTDGQLKTYDGTAWLGAEGSGGSQNLPGLGINATWDATNRLSVSADASLLNHDGAGHQLKINKSNAGDTASLLYQSNFVGHAEMGLAGDTDFSIKVSVDGNSWVDAFVFDATSGTVTGTAVQSATEDKTAGRLMRVGAFGMSLNMIQLTTGDDLDDLLDTGYYFNSTADNTAGNNYPAATAGYLHVMRQNNNRVAQIYYELMDGTPSLFPNVWVRGKGGNGWSQWSLQYNQNNLVGAVSQNAGTPTGAVIESGSTLDGDFVKFADGTMVCTSTQSAVSGSDAIWTFPQSFATAPKVTGTGQGPDRVFSTGSAATSTIATSFRLWRFSGSPTRSGGAVDLIAIGRWF